MHRLINGLPHSFLTIHRFLNKPDEILLIQNISGTTFA